MECRFGRDVEQKVGLAAMTTGLGFLEHCDIKAL